MTTMTVKGRTLDCKFAAVSILTGNFVACVITEISESELRELMTEPGEIRTFNPDTREFIYDGFHSVDEIRKGYDGITVVISKGEQDEGTG